MIIYLQVMSDSFLFVTSAACLGHSHMVLPFFVELHKMFGLILWR